MNPYQLPIPFLNLLLSVLTGIFARKFFTLRIKKNYIVSHYLVLVAIILLSYIPTLIITVIQVICLTIQDHYPAFGTFEPHLSLDYVFDLTMDDRSMLVANGSILLLVLVCLIAVSIAPARAPISPPVGKQKEPGCLKLFITLYLLSLLALPILMGLLIYRGVLGDFVGEYKYGLIRLIPFLVAMGLLLIRTKAMYAAQKDIIELKGQKDLVLYLRSFYLDRIPFASARIKEKEFGELLQNVSPAYIKQRLSFEAYFGFQIKKQLGELVTIGKPHYPEPHQGAATVFLAGEAWANEVRNLIVDAMVILVQVGETQYLKEEFDMIIRSGALTKTYIFIAPASKKKYNAEKLKGFLNTLNIPMDFTPGPGSVISFSSDQKAMLLQTGCKLPSAYINVIAARHAT